MSRDDFFANWSKAHGDAEVKGIVKAWLSISFLITRPLIVLRITPNTLSFLSIIAAMVFLVLIETDWAIFFLVLSLLLDGIDGTVAISTGKTSKFGALVDAVADRIVEGIWAYAFFQLGAPWQVIAVAWSAAATQEYMRARAGGLGVTKVLMVTWSERPVRATLIFIPLVGRVFGLEVFVVAAFAWALLQVTSAAFLFNSLRLHLQQSQR
jgi:archaetidylinositol phosphate synthase